jgi:hypothetical protein
MLIPALLDLSAIPRLLAVVTEWLKRASYTMYPAYFLFVLLVYGVRFKGSKSHLNGWALLLFAELLVSFFAIAQVFWELFGKHSDLVKAFLDSPLRTPGSAPASVRSRSQQ